MSRLRFVLVLLLPASVCTACATVQMRSRSNMLDYLYPEGWAQAAPPSEVTLRLPVRVGLGFVPDWSSVAHNTWSPSAQKPAFDEAHKQRLLRRIADTFRAHDDIGALEVIPSSYVSPGGGFANLERLATIFGIDLIALLAVDQIQFSDSTRLSLTYWTLLGSYLVDGEKNETRTLIEAVVYDIPSRTLLFRAAGESSLRGRSTIMSVGRSLRLKAEQGLEPATDDLIVNLNAALKEFRVQAATGSVRGPGTPAIQVFDQTGRKIESAIGGGFGGSFKGGGGGGAGAFGMLEIGAALLILLAPMHRASRRRCRS